MADKENDKQPEKKEAAVYKYTSHTSSRFTHNDVEFNLHYGNEYKDLPEDSKLVKNLIAQKRLIKL